MRREGVSNRLKQAQIFIIWTLFDTHLSSNSDKFQIYNIVNCENLTFFSCNRIVFSTTLLIMPDIQVNL